MQEKELKMLFDAGDLKQAFATPSIMNDGYYLNFIRKNDSMSLWLHKVLLSVSLAVLMQSLALLDALVFNRLNSGLLKHVTCKSHRRLYS